MKQAAFAGRLFLDSLPRTMRNLYPHGMPLGVFRHARRPMMHDDPEERQSGEVIFHPMRTGEYNIPKTFGGVILPHADLGTRPRHANYLCGNCGKSTNGRVLCDLIRGDKSIVSWCVCSCELSEPTVIVEKDGNVLKQIPIAREFHAGGDWPTELAQLYEEASAAYSAGAFTASSMACRKLLMACACDKGAADDKSFAEYVDYITGTVLTFPTAKPSIDKIRGIGNDANHKVQFVNQVDAQRAMKIMTYMLNTIYSLPSA